MKRSTTVTLALFAAPLLAVMLFVPDSGKQVGFAVNWISLGLGTWFWIGVWRWCVDSKASKMNCSPAHGRGCDTDVNRSTPMKRSTIVAWALFAIPLLAVMLFVPDSGKRFGFAVSWISLGLCTWFWIGVWRWCVDSKASKMNCSPAHRLGCDTDVYR